MPQAMRGTTLGGSNLPPTGTGGRSGTTATLAVVLTFLLSTAAVSLTTVDDLARRAEALWAAGRPRNFATLASVFGWPDAALLVAVGVVSAALAIREWRSRAVSRLLLEGSRWQIDLLLLAVLLWLGQYCFVPGVLLGGDAATHIARFHEVRQALASGHLPLWTNDQYLGSPLLTFTGPLTYVLGGSLDLLIRNPVITGKIFLLAAKIATGVAFYKLLLRWDLRPPAALAGAIGFAGSFAYVQLFLFRGVYPQALTILFLPVLFYAAEGLMTSGRPRAGDWALFAVATAGLIVNHQPHALFAAYYLAIFGLVSLLTRRWRVKGLIGLVTAGSVGVMASMVAVIPIIVQARWVMIAPASGFFDVRLPTTTRLLHLVLWRDTRTNWGDDFWAYLGTALLALAVLGAWAALAGRLSEAHRRIAIAALVCLPLALVTWNPVVRGIMFILFFVAIIAALGVQWLLLSGALRGRGQTLALAALLLDVGSTSVQPVARLDKNFLVAAGRFIEHVRPAQRILEISLGSHGGLDVDIGPNATPMSFYADIQRLAGTHNMAATLVHNYIVSIAKSAQNDLRAHGAIGPETTRLLAMLNVGYGVCASPVRMGCPPRLSPTPDGPLGGVLSVAGASPVLFARRLVQLAPPPGLDKPMLWDEDFRPDARDRTVAAIDSFLARWLQVTVPTAAGHAAALAVRVLPPGMTARPPGDQDDWKARLVSYHVGLQRVDLRVATTAAGYAQLAFPWYPGTRVTINGRPTRPLQGATGLAVVAVPAGEDVIQLSPVVTAAEGISAALSLCGLLALAAGALYLWAGAPERGRP